MPNPQAPNPGTMSVDNSGAPGADLDFDSLFPPEGTEGAAPLAPPAAAATPAPAAPQQDQFFLDVSDKTKYRTREDAARGIAEKDSVIEKLRKEIIDAKGVDPLTGQPVQRPVPLEQVSYTQDPKRFVSDLNAAIQKADPSAFYQTFEKLINEKLSPYGPALATVSRSAAVEMVGNEVKSIRDFISSEDYRSTLAAVPGLKRAIETAELDPRYSGDLPEMYRLAFYAAQGRKALTGNGATPQSVPSNPAPQTPVRQPLNAGSLPAPTGVPVPTSTETILNDRASRQEYLKRMQGDPSNPIFKQTF